MVVQQTDISSRKFLGKYSAFSILKISSELQLQKFVWQYWLKLKYIQSSRWRRYKIRHVKNFFSVLYLAENSKIEVVWIGWENGKWKAGEENNERDNGVLETGGETDNEGERCACEGSGRRRTERGGGETGGPGPWPMERYRAGLMRLQCRGKISQVSDVKSVIGCPVSLVASGRVWFFEKFSRVFFFGKPWFLFTSATLISDQIYVFLWNVSLVGTNEKKNIAKAWTPRGSEHDRWQRAWPASFTSFSWNKKWL